MTKHTIKFLGIFLFFSLLVFAGESWQLKKDKKGIKVYVRSVNETKVNMFKATATYSYPPEFVAKAVLDLDNYHKWIDGIAKGQLIDQISDTEFVFRQVVLLPFPYDNREVVQRSIVSKRKNGEILIKITEANNIDEPLGGHVRMEVSHGYWLLKPTKTGTEVTYSFLADPGENIPSWLINAFIVDSPYNSLLELKSYLAAQ